MEQNEGRRRRPWAKARKRDWKGCWYQILKTWMMEGERTKGLNGRAEGAKTLSQAQFPAGTLDSQTSNSSHSLATASLHWFRKSYWQHILGKQLQGRTLASERRWDAAQEGPRPGAAGGAGAGWMEAEQRTGSMRLWSEDRRPAAGPRAAPAPKGVPGICEPTRTHWNESSHRDRQGRLLFASAPPRPTSTGVYDPGKLTLDFRLQLQPRLGTCWLTLKLPWELEDRDLQFLAQGPAQVLEHNSY